MAPCRLPLAVLWMHLKSGGGVGLPRADQDTLERGHQLTWKCLAVIQEELEDTDVQKDVWVFFCLPCYNCSSVLNKEAEKGWDDTLGL